MIGRVSTGAGLAHGISLWLVPDPASHRVLAEAIDRLAARLGTPRFRPHLTLLGALPGAEAAVIGRTEELASRLTRFELRLLAPSTRPEFFRCVVLEAEASAALLSARQAAAAALGQPASPFEPHVSLVYGQLDASIRAGIVRELPPWPPVVRIEALEAHRTEGAMAAWRHLGGWPLG